MPHVVNGIGTWYYGKRNLITHTGTCEACSQEQQLSTYDTTLYFTVFYIPIIPLGKKRVINECAACQRHLAMSLSKWEKAKVETFDKALAEYEANRGDKEKAEALFETIGAFCDRDGLEAFADQIRDDFRQDPEVLDDLGNLCGSFGLYDDALACFERMMDLKNSDDAREGMARTLVRMGRPEEADPFLDHIREKALPDRVHLLYVLALGYQAKGMHAEALDTLNQIEEIVPDAANDKTFRKSRKTSERLQGSAKPVIDRQFLQSGREASGKSSDVGGLLARIAGPVIVAAILVWIGVASYRVGQSRKIYFVNGLSRPYTVTVNGVSHTLNPNRATPIQVPEGQMNVKVTDDLAIPDRTYPIETPLWSRLFKKYNWVINPDSTAILTKERRWYVAEGEADDNIDNEFSFYAGKDLWEFGRIDYAFVLPPDRLQISADSGSRLYLEIAGTEAGVDQLMALIRYKYVVNATHAAEIALRHLELDPDADTHLAVIADVYEPEELYSHLKNGLEERPIRVNWHRYYQSAFDARGRLSELEDHYRQIHEEFPEDSTALYLYARTLENPDEALPLLTEAASGESPSLAAIRALAFYMLADGETNRAYEYASRAWEMEPGALTFRSNYFEALLASGHYEEYLAALQNDPQTKGYISEFSHSAGIAIAQAYLGQAEAARKTAQEALDALQQDTDTDYMELRRNGLLAPVEYVLGNEEEAIDLYMSSELPELQFAGAISSGSVELAMSIFHEMEEPENDDYLLLFIAANRKGLMTEAQQYLQEVAALLSQGNGDERLFAAALRGESASQAEMLCKTGYDAYKKSVILTALAEVDPENAPLYVAKARSLDYYRAYPHLLLNRYWDEMSTP